MGKVRIGISGWRYAPWRGVFYPRGLKQADELAYAARQFPSIELNGSFYALQRPERYADWHDATPRGFVFAVKAPRFITHIKRLRDIGKPLANFFASGPLALREKLGPLLWQFPPNFRFDETLFDDFLHQLPRTTEQAADLAHGHDGHLPGRAYMRVDRNRRMRHAVEIRHESFANETFVALLRKHKVALVVADTAGKWPRLEDVTADFLYLRLHGDKQLYSGSYPSRVLADWRRRIDAWRQGIEPRSSYRVGPPPPKRTSRDVYCYFDNDMKVDAPVDARRLAKRL
jgi:uncharacterized protein YecE (DUF72 family)